MKAPTVFVILFWIGTSYFVRSSLVAHPIPDLPIFGQFDQNGSSQVEVEIDPRAFADDPEAEPFLTVPALEELNMSARQYLLDQSFELLESSLQIRMNDQKWYLPNFAYEFAETVNKDENNQTIVKIRAFTSVEREVTPLIRFGQRKPLLLI